MSMRSESSADSKNTGQRTKGMEEEVRFRDTLLLKTKKIYNNSAVHKEIKHLTMPWFSGHPVCIDIHLSISYSYKYICDNKIDQYTRRIIQKKIWTNRRTMSSTLDESMFNS